MRRILSTALLLSASWLHLAPAFAHELRFAVSAGPVSLPVYVAEAQGYFKSEGADVKMLDCRAAGSAWKCCSKARPTSPQPPNCW